MMRAVRSSIAGLVAVLRAPLLVAGITLATVATAIPFGLVVGSRLQAALAHQPPIDLGSGEIDAEWWMEFRRHATGLEATFTPAIIGFAAPLDNLSSLLDNTRRPLILALPVAIAAVVWAFLWGGILNRFDAGRRLGLRPFVSVGVTYLPRFVMVSVLAAIAHLILFFTVHALLFGPVYDAIAGAAASERDAFFGRVGLYIVFGWLLTTVVVIADYTRISMVTRPGSSLADGLRHGARFVRRNYLTVLLLCVLVGAMFAALLVVYGATEVYGGSRVGGWRGVILAQAYIVARLVIRLWMAASEVHLFTRRLEGAESSQDESSFR